MKKYIVGFWLPVNKFNPLDPFSGYRQKYFRYEYPFHYTGDPYHADQFDTLTQAYNIISEIKILMSDNNATRFTILKCKKRNTEF